MGQRRLQREWNAYQHTPEVRLAPLFGRGRYERAHAQVFRSLVQVNFYPRPRD
jgi:hypothetical protein